MYSLHEIIILLVVIYAMYLSHLNVVVVLCNGFLLGVIVGC